MQGYTQLKLIPMPKHVEGLNDKGEFAETVMPAKIVCCEEAFNGIIDSFCGYVKKLYGIVLKRGNGGIEIRFSSNKSEKYEVKKDGYIIDFNCGANVIVESKNGAAYALATMLQLIKVSGDNIVFPKISITDYPESNYRGLMIDTARKFHTLEELLNYVDLCFLYKVNYLHIHFIDNQSYTLPSDIFPKLPTYGRNYSKEQIARLVSYARDRNITLIPEFETPGHSAALITNYPLLFGNTFNDNREFVKAGDIYNNADADVGTDNIMCVGKPDIFSNIKKLLVEICEMFPNSPYLHIGGDEAEILTWEKCLDCKRYMQENNIKSANALYTYFIKKITEIVFGLGKIPIVWEGFPEEGSEELSRDIIVIAWESYYHPAPKLIEKGFNIINASWQPLYIVPNKMPWDVNSVLAWNIYNFQHFWEKSTAYLNPIHLMPTKQVLGAQICAWECTYDQEIQRVKEYLAALTERTWSVKRFCTDEQFKDKLCDILVIADKILRK